MTGYGSSSMILHTGENITVEVKTVNQRFLEISSKLPKHLSFSESKLIPIIKKYIYRGRVSLRVLIEGREDTTETAFVDKEKASIAYNELKSLNNSLNLQNEISVDQIVNFPGVICYKDINNKNELWKNILEMFENSLKKVLEMRIIEGEKIKQDIDDRIKTLEESIIKIKSLSANCLNSKIEKLKNLLFENINNTFLKFQDNKNIDFIEINKIILEERLLSESVFLAEKLDIEEEIVRFKSHISQLKSILIQDKPIGRKMDFLLQEILRESNTIASKSQSSEISQLVVNIKETIENIREQVQNIE